MVQEELVQEELVQEVLIQDELIQENKEYQANESIRSSKVITRETIRLSKKALQQIENFKVPCFQAIKTLNQDLLEEDTIELNAKTLIIFE